MTPVAIGSAVGAAALTVGRGALRAVGHGLSFAAELAGTAGGGLTGADFLTGEELKSSQTENAKAAVKQKADDLRQRIQRRLAAGGVQLTQAVELVSNGQGGIAVAGVHPQQAAIEEALGSDVLLERDFNQFAGDYSQIIAAGTAGELPPTLTITIPKG